MMDSVNIEATYGVKPVDPLEGFSSLGEAWEYLSCFADRPDYDPCSFDIAGHAITLGMIRAAVRERG